MEAAPNARLLDLSRLVSRLGREALTGVDRVELAYLTQLLTGAVPLFGLVRTSLGFVLLDAKGCLSVQARALGQVPLGRVDLLGRMARRGEPARARAEADLRRVALARCARPLLGRMLRRFLPDGFTYLNVGHANLNPRVMRAVKAVPGSQVAVLVHDTIPLDHPEFTRDGIGSVFGRKMAVVSAYADLVIYSTADARRKAEAHLARMGRVPPGVVAALGVPEPVPDRGALPKGIAVTQPYFVTIGTIEPRKNHALLLDVWEGLAQRLPPAAMPQLLIIGSRGWANEAVFARLDSVTPGGPVRELPGLSDGAVAALLDGAQALLFPSLAEGFGLPAVEAAALGVPVIASNLPVFRDILDDYPVYLDSGDSYSWMETITEKLQAGGDANLQRKKRAALGWVAHFNAVLNLV